MRRIFFFALVVLCGLGQPATACSVPVFRYALERWKASPFEVTVFSKGPLSEAERETVRRLDGTAHVNIRVTSVDLDKEPTPEQRKRWATHGSAKTLPVVVIAYPDSDDQTPPFWTGPLAELDAAAILDSPTRRLIAERLLSGETAVFLLLEGLDPEANRVTATLLEKEVARLMKATRLPAASEVGPQVESPLPFRIGFSHLRLSRSAPGEEMFVRMLLRCKPGLTNEEGPVVLPFFGRGRLLDALHGEELSAEMLAKVVDFLCGACTCQVKDATPGIDMLFAVDWNGRVFPEIPREASSRFVGASPEMALSDMAQEQTPRQYRRWLWAAFSAVGIMTLASGAWALRSLRRTPNS